MQQLIDRNNQVRHFDTSILAGTKSPNTIDQYRMHFAAYIDFAAGLALDQAQPTNLDDAVAIAIMQPATLARWRQHLYETGYIDHDGESRPYSIAAINQHLAAIRGIMSEAAQQGYITHETAEGFKHIKGLKLVANKERRKSHARTAISSDMQPIIDAPDATTPAGAMHRALLLTLATCGMRASEAVRLKIADIQWASCDTGAGWAAYVLGKNMELPQARPISKQAKQAIDEWLQMRAGIGIQSEYIFTGFSGSGSRNPSNKPITRVSAWQTVQRYAKACNLAHIKPHDFRRFVGTQLAKKDLRLAQKQLGHKRIETTASHYVLDDVAYGATDSLLSG